MRLTVLKENWKMWILPIALCSTFLAHILLFYVGIGWVENDFGEAVFNAVSSLMALLCGIGFLASLKNSRGMRGKLVLVFLWLAVWLAGFLLGLLRFGAFSAWSFRLKLFIGMSLPIFLGGICCVFSGNLKNVFPVLERLSIVVFPIALIYFGWSVFDGSPFPKTRGFGSVNYMSLADGFAIFLMAHILQMLNDSPWELPVLNRKIKYANALRAGMAFVYWVGILASGTRGTIFSMLLFMLLTVVLGLLRKRSWKPTLLLTVGLVALMLFNLFVWAPKGMKGVGRLDNTLQDWSEGNVVTTSSGSDLKEWELNKESAAAILVAADGDQQIANREEEQLYTPENFEADITPDNVAQLNLQIADRFMLFRLAIGEFQKSPLTGMGPFGYMFKYGRYPHNVALELLCELGLCSIPVFLVLLYSIVKLFLLGKKQPEIDALLLFCLEGAAGAMMSGTVWTCGILLGAVAMAILLPRPDKERI